MASAVPNDQRQEYALAVVEAFFAKTRQPERIISCIEYATLDGWIRIGVPLRVVLRAFEETKGRGATLTYYNSAVMQEHERVTLALSGTR